MYVRVRACVCGPSLLVRYVNEFANKTAHNCILCPCNKFDCKALSHEAQKSFFEWSGKSAPGADGAKRHPQLPRVPI